MQGCHGPPRHCIGLCIIPDKSKTTSAKNITNPSQCRPAKTIKRDPQLEKIIGCHSEKAVNDKTAKKKRKKLPWNRNHCFRGLLLLTNAFFCLFLSFLSFAVFLILQISNHAPAQLFIFLLSLVPPSLRSQDEFTEPFQGIKIPFQTNLTLHLLLHLSSLKPHCSVFFLFFLLLLYLQTEHMLPNGRKRET